eukprot:COSAG06_NODE_3162_length_5751_cov_4.227176_2_plen_291_part_00
MARPSAALVPLLTALALPVASMSAACNISLTKQQSKAACVPGTSFGCSGGANGSSMWTDKGCRGVFECSGVRNVACSHSGLGRHTCPCTAADPNAGKTLMNRVLLQHTKAIDGTPALYYIDRNASSSKYVIWLEGGGICQSLADCEQRANGSLGSSKSFQPSQAFGQGMMQSDPKLNPDFNEWTRIYVPYVSGDVWSGAATSALNPFPREGAEEEAGGWTGWFQGHSIVEEVLVSLRQTAGLGGATDVILTGCSAGGKPTARFPATFVVATSLTSQRCVIGCRYRHDPEL